ncbi:ATP-dependent 6-phosphofructokinase [Bowmanella sp. JS7-9]|uniref:6-phosphofructokinase n=1 Tax=Pseudobowmanella zhangzhouensis TaxID=1537679 RepID=A0ABW1XK27_9ALTE|nr:ATP-dependent 6-phosphofructokinase [Bowmanella sp. JS7-9]TBX23135.1 6-phosphofructokinase [Bowmanella sp. JS7-9]
MIKRIAVLTSGGDAPGMNACIRAVVLTAHTLNLQVIGYRHGYNGLLSRECQPLHPGDVFNIIQRGGTILRSARCPEFVTEESAHRAAKNLDDMQIDALLVIGGNGSFKGMQHLAKFWNGKLIGMPGTIDNDIAGTDATIGYYTAIDTALEAIDKVRDTADAFERIFLIEVMGRHAGFIGLASAVGSGAEQMLLPELLENGQIDVDAVVAHVEKTRAARGKCSYIIVTTENLYPGGATALAAELNRRMKVDCRAAILGYIQRGGSPVSLDRILATKLGAYAVEMAVAGQHLMMAGEHHGEVVAVPLEETFASKPLDPYLVRIQRDFFDLLKLQG